jgi:chromosomal replication initiation ATPase DnaA
VKVLVRSRTPRRDAVIAMSLRFQSKQREARARSTQKLQERAAAISPGGIRIAPWSSPAKIVDQVAFWSGVPAVEILGYSRIERFIVARFDAIVAVAINCRIDNRPPTPTDLGRYFGRDHATILNALKQRGLR